MSFDKENKKGKEFWDAMTPGATWYKPKTKFRISFPAGDSIKLLNLAEINAPGGMSILFKLPFPMSEMGLNKLLEQIKNAGGSVEIEN